MFNYTSMNIAISGYIANYGHALPSSPAGPWPQLPWGGGADWGREIGSLPSFLFVNFCAPALVLSGVLPERPGVAWLPCGQYLIFVLVWHRMAWYMVDGMVCGVVYGIVYGMAP